MKRATPRSRGSPVAADGGGESLPSGATGRESKRAGGNPSGFRAGGEIRRRERLTPDGTPSVIRWVRPVKGQSEHSETRALYQREFRAERVCQAFQPDPPQMKPQEVSPHLLPRLNADPQAFE